MKWQSIETAPKDGRAILLLSAPDTIRCDGEDHDRPAKVAIGHWNPNGSSWVDEIGDPDGEAYTLTKTGLWMSGGGWFQPNEVTHWMSLPEIPNHRTPSGVAFNEDQFSRSPYSWVLIPQPEGGYMGKILEFPGCITEGETAEEAMENLAEAARGWVSASIEAGHKIPAPMEQ